MTIKEVLLLGNPNLREICAHIEEFNSNLDNIVEDLKDTLLQLQKEKRIGRAIAAPQIDYLKRVIFYNLPDRTFTMVNPEIIWHSKETIDVWDSCFCFKVEFFVNIRRYKTIKVQFQDKKGNKVVETFDNSISELVQHEIDHLNGILATDHLQDMKNIIMRAEWEQRYRKDG